MPDVRTESQPSGVTRGAWAVVAALWVVAMLNYLDRQVLVTMRDAIKGDVLADGVMMTDARFGMLSSVFLWTYGALSPIGGYVADRLGRRPVILVSLAVWSAVTWWTGHVTTYDQLLVARAAMGVSEACYIPAALAMITDRHRGSTGALATGLHMSGLYTGMIAGGLGGYLATPGRPLFGFDVYIGWHKVFVGLGAIGVAYALVLMFILPKESADRAPASAATTSTGEAGLSRALARLAREPRFLFLLGMFALVSACNWSVLVWLPAFLKERFLLADGPAGLHATGWNTAVKFVAVIACGIISDRLLRRTTRARSLVPAVGLMLAVPGILFGTFTESLVCCLAGFALQGVAQGALDANLMPLVRQVAGGTAAATAYGLMNFSGCAAGGLMAIVGGRLKDTGAGFEMFFRLSAAGMFVAALVLLFFKPAEARAE